MTEPIDELDPFVIHDAEKFAWSNEARMDWDDEPIPPTDDEAMKEAFYDDAPAVPDAREGE